MKTSTLLVLGLGGLGIAWLLSQPSTAAGTSSSGTAGGASGAQGGGTPFGGGTAFGTGTPSNAGALRAGTNLSLVHVVPGTGTIFGTGPGTDRAYRGMQP